MSGSFNLVLTVICLSVLMSLEADAQSTTDETKSCSSSSLEKVVNLVDRIASVHEEIAEKMKKLTGKPNQQQNASEIKDVKELIASNSSALHEVLNLVNTIASVQQDNAEKIVKFTSHQQRNANEIKDLKGLFVSNSSEFQEVVGMVRGFASVQEENAKEIKKISSVQQEIKEQLAGNSSVLEKIGNSVQKVAENLQENANGIKDVKKLLGTNSSALEEVVNLVKIIASNQKENAKKIEKIASVQQEIKEQLAGNSSALKEVLNLVKRTAPVPEENAKHKNASKSCECDAVDPSKQALVSALVSEFVSFHSTHIILRVISLLVT